MKVGSYVKPKPKYYNKKLIVAKIINVHKKTKEYDIIFVIHPHKEEVGRMWCKRNLNNYVELTKKEKEMLVVEAL
jgi:hypothetical protein